MEEISLICAYVHMSFQEELSAITETQKLELAEITKKLCKVEQELTKRELSIIDEEMRIKKQYEQQMSSARQIAEVMHSQPLAA